MIYNNQLGINEKDIAECTDIQRMNEWKIQIRIQLAKVKSKLEVLKGIHLKGGQTDYSDFVKTKGFKRVLGLTYGFLEQRQAELTRAKKAKNAAASKDENRKLILILKGLVTDQLWEKAIDQLHNRK